MILIRAQQGVLLVQSAEFANSVIQIKYVKILQQEHHHQNAVLSKAQTVEYAMAMVDAQAVQHYAQEIVHNVQVQEQTSIVQQTKLHAQIMMHHVFVRAVEPYLIAKHARQDHHFLNHAHFIIVLADMIVED